MKKEINLDEIFCGNCGETHVFLLKDKNTEFMIGLQNILECLRFAEKQGIVPELPSIWWIQLRNQYINIKDWFE